MSGLNIKVADLQISDFHAPECCFLWWHTEKIFSFWGQRPQTPTRGFAPGPHWGPTAAPRPPHHFPPFSLFPSPMSEYLSGWTQIVLDLGGWNVGGFLSPLHFTSGDQCCDTLACPCWESSSSLWAPLPCQLQTRCDICCACQSVCPFIPTDSGMPRTVDPQKSL